ncbi:MAG: hypothetical protein GKR89_01095 [Candidatus Latescibacteria bacterium]|nr:hypothetical protein [Candidatus Latescibacterota bacterium]
MKLNEAAKRGKVDIVLDALAQDPSANPQPLLEKVCQDFHSIRKGDAHFTLARHLLDCGARPTLALICEAARGGHGPLVQILCQARGQDDIFTAAALGDWQSLQCILQTAPDQIAVVDDQDMTPLHYVCASSLWKNDPPEGADFVAACDLLLAAGSQVDAVGSYHGLDGITPLFYCAWTGGHLEVAQRLLQHGAAISPNIFYAAVGHFQRHGDGHYEIAALLLGHGFDINYCDSRTPLHAFAAHEDARGVAWLLANGAAVEACDDQGNTPLHLAAARNSGTKVLQLLVDAGAPIQARNHAGQRPQQCALERGKQKGLAFFAALDAR